MTTITDNKVSSSLMAAMNGTQASKGKEDTSAVQDRFMTLLVTQMKNQDPLNPMDNAQMTSQLAQLSTVSGIDKLNSTLESLKGSYQSSQSLQATSMIGRGVLVPGSKVQLAEGQGIFGVELPGPADSVKVTIRDATGKAVQTINLASQEAGTIPLAWDGKTDTGTKANDGSYTVEVEAMLGSEKTTVNPLTFGQVNSVSTGSQGVKVNVPAVGMVNFSDIKQIL